MYALKPAQWPYLKLVHTGPLSLNGESCLAPPPSFPLTAKLQAFGKDLPKSALELYPTSVLCPTRDRCPERALTTMVSDIRVTCPNGDMALRAEGEPAQPTAAEGAGGVRRAP